MTKDVRYNRLNREHDMFLNGRYVGSRDTAVQAWKELDRLAYEALTHGGA